MSKRIVIIIQSAPYRSDSRAWDGLRFAGAALAQGMEVRVHLLGEGAVLAQHHQSVPATMADLEALLSELLECGLIVSACGMALDNCAIAAERMITGIERGSMKLLAGWIAESDLVMTF